MIAYIGVFIMISLLSIYEFLFENKNAVFITFLILATFAGLRYKVGYDFGTYFEFYNEIESISDVFSGAIDAETGYLILNYLFIKLGLNYHTFLLFFSFFALGLLTIYLYRNFKEPSIYLVYYFSRFYLARDMGQIRGSIASIILLFSVKYIKEKKFLPFFLVVFLAAQFHISAYIFILGYVFLNWFPKLTLKNSLFILILAVFVGMAFQIQSLYDWFIPERYLAYFVNPHYTSGKWLRNPVLWMQLIFFYGALMLTNIQEKLKIQDYHSLYFIASISLIAFGTLSTIGGRLSSPFATYEIFVVPYFILNFTNNKILNAIMLFFVMATLFIITFIISGDYLQYIPYNSFFSNM